MKAPPAKVWIGVLSAVLVGMLVLGSLERTSPGPVTAVHGRIADIAQGQSCSQCHGGLWTTMAEACLDCHEVIAGQLDQSTGLHGTLGEHRATQCGLCHSDHHGEDFAMVNRMSFAQAGFNGAENFDHAAVGFAMGGAHLDLDCSACHEHADAAILPPGATRYIGLSQDCASCHEDSHEGRYVLDCTACHGQQDFLQLESRDHGAHLPLTGGHESLDCSACHGESGPHALESLGTGGGLGLRQRGCVDCHDSSHSEDFLRGVAGRSAESAESTDATCAQCHQSLHVQFADSQDVMSAALHAHSGFPLTAPHGELDCSECHGVASEESFAARFPGRNADACEHCHQDPHDGQFGAATTDSGRCLRCHERTEFLPHAFSLEDHDRDAFALTGTHRETECELCHQRETLDEPRRFRGTVNRCEECHSDAHGGFFDQRLAVAGVDSTAGTCALCHGTDAFHAVPEATFDHDRWTDFPIHGAHTQMECEACHARVPEPDRHGRSFGRVAEHFGTFVGCATCHEDPHRGRFDRLGQPAEVDGRSGCARCHTDTSFRLLQDDFDHGRWTGFVLEGAHQHLDCSQCHEPLNEPALDGRSWSPAAGTNCSDCHQDSHQGQFGSAVRADCRRCHRSARGFHELSFRHDLDSRFKLGDAHESLACSACHKREVINGVETVRYRPIPRLCSDCHGAEGRALPRRGGGR